MKTRQIFLWAGLVALGAIIIVNFGYINHFIDVLDQVHWYVFILVIATQLWSYYSNAKFYQAFLAIFDYKIESERLFEAAIAINFVNQAFPSGGVSGASYLSQYLHGEVPVGKAALAQFGRYIFTFFSFLGVLVLGFLMLFLTDNVSRLTVRITLLFILFLIILSLLLVTVVADRARVERLALILVSGINKINQMIRRRRKRLITLDQVNRFFNEFYEGYYFLLSQRGHWRLPLLYTLSGSLAEVATVYVVFLAFGNFINPGVVIAGYTLANVISIIAVISGGVGVYELTMITAFVALGVPFALAVSVVIVYRVLNFALFLPIGFYLYRKQLTE
jgi:Mg2+-importing ATPase